jgi:signal transduction histidine kinase
MSRAAPTLRKQIVISFLSFAALVSMLFAVSSFIIAYVVEDAMFKEPMVLEAARQQDHWRRFGRLAPPSSQLISIHTDVASLPADLKSQLSPSQILEEYRGSGGRYYHVLPFVLAGGAQVYAVAEVGDRLVVRALRGELLLLVIFSAFAMLLAAGALGYWLAVRATAPLSRLVETVSEVQPGGLPRMVPGDFPDNEVGILARTIQLMLERTHAFVERESRFTRDASHELRTPLAVIKSSVELIQSRGRLPGTLTKPMRRVAEAVRQMEQSVELLLLLAREEQAQSPEQDLLLLPLVERLVLTESARYDAGAFNVLVSMPSDTKTPFNEAVVSMILSNLIGNAFRHNTAVDVLVAAEGTDVLIRDSGRGIPENVLVGLDEGSATADAPQRGLGLPIVSRLCRVHSIPFGVQSSPAGTSVRIGLLRKAGALY